MNRAAQCEAPAPWWRSLPFIRVLVALHAAWGATLALWLLFLAIVGRTGILDTFRPPLLFPWIPGIAEVLDPYTYFRAVCLVSLGLFVPAWIVLRILSRPWRNIDPRPARLRTRWILPALGLAEIGVLAILLSDAWFIISETNILLIQCHLATLIGYFLVALSFLLLGIRLKWRCSLGGLAILLLGFGMHYTITVSAIASV